MRKEKNCYRTRINGAFLLKDKLLKHAEDIVINLGIKARSGGPLTEFSAALNGIFYLLKTGVQWKGMTRCFGSSSAIHRLFQKLRAVRFFKLLWHKELQK